MDHQQSTIRVNSSSTSWRAARAVLHPVFGITHRTFAFTLTLKPDRGRWIGSGGVPSG
jgi:hypothetical protein